MKEKAYVKKIDIGLFLIKKLHVNRDSHGVKVGFGYQ